MAGVAVEKSQCDLVKCSLDRCDLGEYVDAITVILDHALDSADLTLHPT
jgi:hypothetical protein